jgi:glycosyltransferase involved in cell wall biosynthesis
MEKRRLCVLLLVAGLDIGGAHGGAERFGLELSRHLDSNEVDILLCAFWSRGGKAESHWYRILQEDGITVFFAAKWKGKFDLWEYMRGLRNLARHCKSAQVDIIHSNFQMGTVAAIVLKIFGYSHRAMRTAHITREWGEGIIALILRFVFQNWLYPLFLDAEVGVSQGVVRQLKAHIAARLWRKYPYLIYNAINSDALNNKASKQTANVLSKTETDLIVGTIGRMTRQKGFIYLIQAMPQILTALPNVRFVFIGSGELLVDLRQYTVKQGVEERVRFLGQCEEVLPLLKSMDLFVLPSLWEGFPTVVLESMACGVPVVATDIPGTNELIQSGITGWLVQPGDSRALSEAIIKALKAPALRAEIAQRAKEAVKAFSFGVIARQYEELYQLISNHIQGNTWLFG